MATWLFPPKSISASFHRLFPSLPRFYPAVWWFSKQELGEGEGEEGGREGCVCMLQSS